MELLDDHKVIGLKWIYKIKKNADGKIVEYKARLIAKGYVQEQGADVDEIFAPVTRLEIVRLMLALAAKNSWEVHHHDVKTNFLNGEITEEVYVSQSEGFVVQGQQNLVYRLYKALYGLRQAPRAGISNSANVLRVWDSSGILMSMQFTRKEMEIEKVVIIAVYVDDLLITGSDVSIIEDFKKQMNGKFEMSNLGRLSYYLGIKVARERAVLNSSKMGVLRNCWQK